MIMESLTSTISPCSVWAGKLLEELVSKWPASKHSTAGHFIVRTFFPNVQIAKGYYSTERAIRKLALIIYSEAEGARTLNLLIDSTFHRFLKRSQFAKMRFKLKKGLHPVFMQHLQPHYNCEANYPPFLKNSYSISAVISGIYKKRRIGEHFIYPLVEVTIWATD